MKDNNTTIVELPPEEQRSFKSEKHTTQFLGYVAAPRTQRSIATVRTE